MLRDNLINIKIQLTIFISIAIFMIMITNHCDLTVIINMYMNICYNHCDYN